ncbi:putative ABC transport system permease protein [Micrococcus sp. 140720015-1]
MTLRTLLREALTAARTSPVPSTLVLLVVAAMCFAAVATVGRQAATEAAVATELSGPAARVLTVTDSGGAGFLTGATVATLAGLDAAEAALARDIPVDAVNTAIGAGGTPVAVAHVAGTLDRGIELTRGRLPGPGEVVVPEAKLAELGLAQPSGALDAADGRQWAVVGAFEARTPFEDLDGYALAVPAAPATFVLQQVRVLAPDSAGTRAMQDSALAVIDPDPRSSQVQTARALAAGSQAITGELAGLGRSLLLLILGAGAFFVAIVVLADVLIRRRDLGRRRTLGIGRAALVLLVAVRTAVPAVLGAAAGAGAGYAVVAGQGGALGLDFVAGVAVLAALTAVVASLLPAAFAAFRDPVRVMRTA